MSKSQGLIYFIKILAAGFESNITAIIGENDEKEKETIDIELDEQNADPENDENAIHFRWSGVHEEDEENIDLANFIENYKSKLVMKNFLKK